MTRYALDTGPLVAFLNRRDESHEWARTTLDTVRPPLITCEAVVSETCFLMRSFPAGPDAVFELLHRDILRVEFALGENLPQVRKLLAKYRTVPMALADACLVRMAELDASLSIITLDSDFRVYRRHGRQHIPLVSPA